ncbi:hypothetical protein KOW79_009507 [Hemibagrus wyckioides]|uniref:Uncharacterized protein n=1 Tax=Hemibagrus wyckioides TaxID=337641 RepID=A0A9D3SIW5_9TELE|nr:hypothetical protein KOW79_009507 [Hemibagrus wyckioides]
MAANEMFIHQPQARRRPRSKPEHDRKCKEIREETFFNMSSAEQPDTGADTRSRKSSNKSKVEQIYKEVEEKMITMRHITSAQCPVLPDCEWCPLGFTPTLPSDPLWGDLSCLTAFCWKHQGMSVLLFPVFSSCLLFSTSQIHLCKNVKRSD